MLDMGYQPHSILAIDVTHFSRSLAVLPAMRALRDAYPKTFIIAAAPSGTCGFVDSGELADETIDLGVVKPGGGDYGGSIKRVFRLMKRARRDSLDMAIDFSPRFETQLLLRMMPRGRVITPSRISQIFESLFERGGRVSRSTSHADECASALKRLGIEIEDTRLGIALPEEANEHFEQLLSRHGSRGGEPIVVLYSSKAGGTRGWPIEHFSETSVRLVGDFGARIVAADEPADNRFTKAIEKLLPKGSIKLQRPHALELAAAIARASLFITDDTEITQIGLDFDTPVLEISDSPQRSSRSKRHRVVYGASRVRITPSEIYEVACEMLQEGRTVSLFRR